MFQWLLRLATFTVVAAITVLTVTALPTLSDHHMAGQRLMLHMMGGGCLVFALPAFGLFFLGRAVNPSSSSGWQRTGFWLLIATALVCIASVFVCMLPLPTTEQMHELMTIHGYAGFATVPAAAVLLFGALRWRRIQATRSATPG